ncbi:hypothetical protein AVEN_105419-1 [Araneus ventricosus]|uniref:Uncharacterized protein n=1 Tax=Araneus ventricosus TaxID=182803 RepID=A0A4Y2IES0_ARAVE|nr:hypothetical protein AVEN_105419-1 [Araneus ventricosus]
MNYDQRFLPIEIAGILIGDILVVFRRVVIWTSRVVGFTMSMPDHGYSTSNPLFDEQMHVDICEEIQLHICHLQCCLPSQARRSQRMCRI